ncbi:hemicentin-2-like, partial [Ctenocephalides felis]
PAQVVWAAIGHDVELPCDITPATPRDTINMVLWFKDSPIPLYSLDARGGLSLDKANHSALGSDLGRRVYFLVGEGPKQGRARLQVKNIQPEDGGVFRCRVDFTDSPTRNFKVNLTLIVPPSEPRIFDDQGRELSSVAGPFKEGSDLFLSCQVTGGLPRPEITWWRDGILLDGVVDTDKNADTAVNQLLLRSIGRDMYGSKLECRAQGSYLIPPVVRIIHLRIYLKPLKVKIVSGDELLSAGTTQHIRCESWGSVPPAKITWLLNSEPVQSTSSTISPYDSVTHTTLGKNSTTSILKLNVVAQDGGKKLTCRASNPWFNGAIIEDTRTIVVAYAPIVSLQLTDSKVRQGESLDPMRPQPLLVEGGYAELHCQTQAHPPVHTYVWFKDNGVLIPEKVGMFSDKSILRIPSVGKETAGVYVCGATNSEGDARSAPVTVKVQYSPRCKSGFEEKSVGALRNGTLTVRCEIEADPLDDSVKFSWTYNNTKDVLPVPSSRVSSLGGISQLQYTPVSNNDFGTLACWASNRAGRQKIPCLFHVVPAKVPQPPGNCILSEQTGSLDLTCTPGFDGGLHQHFLLEVISAANTEGMSASSSSSLSTVTTRRHPADADNEISTMNDQSETPALYRMTETDPHFRVRGLLPGRDYQLLVWAVNAQGRSEPPVIIERVRVALPMSHVGALSEGPSDVGQTLPANTGQATNGAGNIISGGGKASHKSVAVILGALISAAGLILSAILFATILVVCKKRNVANEEIRIPEEQLQSSSRPRTEGPSMYSGEMESSSAELDYPIHRKPAEITITPLRNSRASRQLPDSIVRFSQPSMNEPDLILARSVDPGFVRT